MGSLSLWVLGHLRCLSACFYAKQMTSNGNLIFVKSVTERMWHKTQQSGTPLSLSIAELTVAGIKIAKYSIAFLGSPTPSEFIHCHHKAENSPVAYAGLWDGKFQNHRTRALSPGFAHLLGPWGGQHGIHRWTRETDLRMAGPLLALWQGHWALGSSVSSLKYFTCCLWLQFV